MHFVLLSPRKAPLKVCTQPAPGIDHHVRVDIPLLQALGFRLTFIFTIFNLLMHISNTRSYLEHFKTNGNSFSGFKFTPVPESEHQSIPNPR